jgi:hypothetical protein
MVPKIYVGEKRAFSTNGVGKTDAGPPMLHCVQKLIQNVSKI